MPLYEFKCQTCRGVVVHRRPFGAMNEPGPPCCGAPTERLFSITDQIHIPTAFKSVRRGGAEGGYSWSDFHDVSEREMAKDPTAIPYNELMSKPDIDGSMRRKKERDRLIEESFRDALAEVRAKESNVA